MFLLLAAGLVAVSQSSGRVGSQLLGGPLGVALTRIMPSARAPLSLADRSGCLSMNGGGCPVRVVQGLTGIPRGDGRTVAFIVAPARRD